MKKILVIDQGTTSSRAILFDTDRHVVCSHQIEHTQYFPELTWVEHDPEEIWSAVKQCCDTVLQQTTADEILGMGISNQRETTIIWDKVTGRPIYNAIVWQDRRTAGLCQHLKSDHLEPLIYEKTGLLLDPYFSATKIKWLLETIPDAADRAKKGELLFGTIDCYLLWRLTNGRVHATDITNASRTLLFNINNLCWDEDLLQLFNIPREILPTVVDNTGVFGQTDKSLFGQEIPILAMMGDQQAALIGQNCTEKGSAKSTYGTGCFLMLNTGKARQFSECRLLNTIAYKINDNINYAIEGSIFAAGSIIKWLINKMAFVKNPAETDIMAKSLADNGGVYFVPAFTGLGAPYWEPQVKGAILGLTRDTGAAHIVRAGLEAIAYQTKDLLNEKTIVLESLKVDGGVTYNTWLMQFLADILQLPIYVNPEAEATSLGIAQLILFETDLSPLQSKSQIGTTYYPIMSKNKAADLYQGWLQAVKLITSPLVGMGANIRE